MKGWCPVHDRVYETPDGLCPRCGSALVPGEEDDHPADHVEPVVVSTSDADEGSRDERRGLPSSRTLIAAASVAVAFVIGLAFPRGGTREAQPELEAVRADYTLGTVARDAGVGLRLDSFTQDGLRIVARFGVLDAAIPTGRLLSATITLQSHGSVVAEKTIPVRATVSGFILEGPVLPSPYAKVDAIGIRSLRIDTPGHASVTLDLDGVWPATKRNEPRARHVAEAIELPEGRRLRVAGIIGWAGRVEVVLVPDHPRAGWTYDDAFTLVSNGSPIHGEDHPASGSITVSFDDALITTRLVTLRVDAVDLVMRSFGGWLWNLS